MGKYGNSSQSASYYIIFQINIKHCCVGSCKNNISSLMLNTWLNPGVLGGGCVSMWHLRPIKMKSGEEAVQEHAQLEWVEDIQIESLKTTINKHIKTPTL